MCSHHNPCTHSSIHPPPPFFFLIQLTEPVHMQQTQGARKGLFTLGPLHNRLYPLPDQCAMQRFSRSTSTKLPCHVLQARIFTMPYGKNKKLSQRKFRQQQFRARLHHNRPTGVVMTPLVGNHTQFRQDDTAENVMFQWLKLRISTGRAF